MQQITLSNILVKGELAVRTVRNYSRLEGQWYRPDEVFTADQHGWPGDWEGRIILALCLLTQCTHRPAAYLDEIVEKLPEHFNSRGYLGKELPEGCFDEQQMAGHSWLIRGLLEYYKMSGDKKIYDITWKIVEKLLLPAIGYYKKYPIENGDRQKQNTWILSKLQTKTKNHAESSDAGCAFIMLDGASAAYEVFQDERIKLLIDEMMERYCSMDFQSLHIQTHATLSALRGICRMYEITSNREYLNLVEKIFRLYKTEALSEAYGNYNWFGIPRWTESCAVIDSFILSMNLWKCTGKRKYLEDAHHIYYNAIAHGQRAEGGFGTDICTGAADASSPLILKPVTYDVYWCCNMRGGECMARAAEALFYTEKDQIYLPFYNSCEGRLVFADGEIVLEEKCEYPYEGSILLTIKKSTLSEKKRLCFFLPPWAKLKYLTVNGEEENIICEEGFVKTDLKLREGDVIAFSFTQKLKMEKTRFKNSVKGYRMYSYGPMLLGCNVREENEIVLPSKMKFRELGKGVFQGKGSEYILSPLCDVAHPTTESSEKQMLFRINGESKKDNGET